MIGQSTLPPLVKTLGYLVSTASVLLLGVVSWKSTQSEPLLRICLCAGMGASILGMILRWASYQLEKKAGE
jgi:hypothetical protein